MTTEEMLTALGTHGGDLVGQIADGTYLLEEQR
jgi:hypothetical protein